MGLLDQQYQPISDEETATNDGMSLGAVRDVALSINSYVATLGAPILLASGWYQGEFSHNSTTETVMWTSGARLLEPHYRSIIWTVIGKATTASGTVKLYVMSQPYRGPAAFSSTHIHGWSDSDSGTIGTSYDSHEGSIDLLRGPYGIARELYLMITMTAGASGTLFLTNPTITAQVE